MPNEQTQNEEINYEQVFGITADKINEIRQQAVAKAQQTQHVWRQKGFWLVCKTCENHHAIWVQGKVMVGEREDGTPILEKDC